VLQRQADSLQDQVANFVLQLRSVNSSTKTSGRSEANHEMRPLNVARSA
jgi:hypothetical protein